MVEADVIEELDVTPFIPLRVHLVSGKTIDVTRQNAAVPLRNRLLVLRNMNKNGVGAEGYDVSAYENIERIEQLDIGKRVVGKRKPA